MAHLTDREEQVYNYILEGKTNKQIADSLFLSVASIKSYVKRLFCKFGVNNRTELIIYSHKYNTKVAHCK